MHNILIVVDLPAPLGPKNANTSPAATENETSLTASKSPKRFTRPRTLTANSRSPTGPTDDDATNGDVTGHQSTRTLWQTAS